MSYSNRVFLVNCINTGALVVCTVLYVYHMWDDTSTLSERDVFYRQNYVNSLAFLALYTAYALYEINWNMQQREPQNTCAAQ